MAFTSLKRWPFVNMENYRKGWREQILFLLLIGYFVFGYLPLAAFMGSKGFYHVVGFEWERKIPFMVPFILGYSLVYASIFLIYWVIPSWEIFKKMVWGFFWMTTIHYLFFYFFPVKMIWRPEIVEVHTFFDWLARFIFSLDNTYNCFPSLHVAYPTLATVLAWRFIPKHRYFFMSLAFITAVSVVLVKQHYILDAVAGAAIAIVVGVLIPQN